MFVDTKLANPFIIVPDGILELTQVEKTFNKQEMYIRGSGYENIYPGAVVYVNGNITAGSPDPVGTLKRAPVTIYADFLAPESTKQENVGANSSAVRGAVDRIMRILLSDKRYDAPGMQRPSTAIYTSMKKLMMDFKVDSSFAGVGLKVDCNTNSSESKFIHATTFEQDYFTIRLDDKWKWDPSVLFDESLTWNDISKIIGNKAIAIVTSVTYGRTFSYLKEYSARNSSYEGKQVIKGYGQSLNSSQNATEEATSLKEDIFNLGGTPLANEVLRSKKTQEEIENAIANNMKFSESNQGVVVKYTIALITGGSPGSIITPKYDGRYYETAYRKCPNYYSVAFKQEKNFTHIAGAKNKIVLDVSTFKVENGKKTPVYTMKTDFFEKATTDNKFTSRMEAPKDQYFDKIQLRIRYQKCLNCSYNAGPIGLIDDKSFQSGKIDIVVGGTQRAGGNGVYIHSDSITKLK